MLFMGVVKTGACVVASSVSSKKPPLTVPWACALDLCSRWANWLAWLEDSVTMREAAKG